MLFTIWGVVAIVSLTAILWACYKAPDAAELWEYDEDGYPLDAPASSASASHGDDSCYLFDPIWRDFYRKSDETP